MSDKFEERSPGLTFWHKGASRYTVPATGKAKAALTLECDIEDETLWVEVEKKFFTGFRVHTSDDFHIIVMDALRDGHKELETRLRDAERALAQEREEHRACRRELDQYKSVFGRFNKQLQGE